MSFYWSAVCQSNDTSLVIGKIVIIFNIRIKRLVALTFFQGIRYKKINYAKPLK